AASQRLDGFECDAGNFNSQAFVSAVTKHNLHCLHARDLLPGDSAAILTHAVEHDAMGALRRNIFDAMVYAAPAETAVFSLQLRLDRSAEADFPAQSLRLASFLQSLLDAPLDTPYAIAIQVRQPPPFPKSLEWQRAIDICGIANSNRIGLCLHFHPDDFTAAPELTPAKLLAECVDKLHAICFHYNPMAGETLFDDEQQEWAALLLQQNYNGLVTFCPEVNASSNPAALCEDAESWADFYRAS
ncbi:MAG TPA: hypothetical protein PKY10_04185, partial [Lentisphaeria bacterium]|nr:hypothetical protein [Lentisphaeria bacterium]